MYFTLNNVNHSTTTKHVQITMRQFRLILLLSVAIICSGYRWRCYAFCNEQTAVQNDYTEQRDGCRGFAQDNLDAEMAKTKNPDSGKARKAKLVVLFAECMSRYGWEVPVPNEKGDKDKLADKGDVPIYVSSASKLTSPTNDSTSAVITEPNTTTPNSETTGQKDEYPRKTPTENIKKQSKESTSTKEIQKQNDSNSSSVVTQKPDVFTTTQSGESQPENMRNQPATSARSITKTKKPKAAKQNQEKQSEKTQQQQKIIKKSETISKTETKIQKTEEKERAQPVIVQQQPTAAVRSQTQPTNSSNGNIEQQPSVTAKTKPKVAAKATPNNPDQALSEAIQEKSATTVSSQDKPKPVTSAPTSSDTQQKEIYARKVPAENIQIQKQSVVNTESKTISETKTTTKEIKGQEQINPDVIPPVANPAPVPNVEPNAEKPTIPTQPSVTKKKKTSKQRSSECEAARRSANTSSSAAELAKACDLECAKLMETIPKTVNPAPCPAKDAAVNLLDIQLGNKK